MDSEQTHISIVLENGQVMIMHLIKEQRKTPHSQGWKIKGTTEEIEREISRANTAWDSPVKSWRVIDMEDVPKDRTFRNAIRDDGNKFSYDMVHVRQIHLGTIREQRAPLLAQKDIEWMRAIGQGNKKEQDRIEKERQALRDMPQTYGKAISEAKTPEEVKAIWPKELEVEG